MKCFLKKSLLLLLILLLVDISFGKAFDYMLKNARGGENARNYYLNTQVDSDILLFGSSRCTHHYNPNIIQDSLKMTCYNAGQDGNGAIYNYARYKLICQRYSPKLIIYDITPMFDLIVGDDNHRYLGSLRPYYEMKGIPEIFDMVDKTERIKMKSYLFRYNSQFLQIVNDFVYPTKSSGVNGFIPIYEKFDTMKVGNRNTTVFTMDSLKILCLNKIIHESKSTEIIFCVSPIWYGMNSEILQPIKELCNKEKILFVDFSNDPKYIHNNNLFHDGLHLNSKGADEFTRDLCKLL